MLIFLLNAEEDKNKHIAYVLSRFSHHWKIQTNHGKKACVYAEA
jgi:hypothetical protein